MGVDSVSVIIPVHNGAAFLRETIDSVLAQSHTPAEVLVVDDGSTDDSADIVRSFGDRLTLMPQAHGGVASARNHGLAHARGEYIAFIDQDDLWHKDKTATQLACLASQPELDYVLSRQAFFLEPGTAHPSWLKPELLTGDYAGYGVGAMLCRRRTFDKIGRFDERFRYADDTSWFFHAKDMGLAMTHLPEVGLYKRVHGANASGQIPVIHRELLAVVRQSIVKQRRQEPA